MGLVILVIFALYVSLTHLLSNVFYRQVGDELMAQATEYAQMASTGSPMMVQMICMNSGSLVAIFDQNGHIVAQSGSVESGVPNASDKSDIGTALKGQSMVTYGNSGIFGTTGTLVMTPIIRGSSTVGVVAMLRPESAVSTAFRGVEWLIFLAGIGASLLAIGLTVVLSSRIARPLREMAKLTKELSRGQYDRRLTVTSEDEIAELGQAINSLAGDLNRLQITRREFLADVAHEVRTPLSYIRGYSQVLIEGLAKSPDEEKKYLSIIHSESERIEGLVNDLFALAQADEGILQINKESSHLEDVIRESVARFEHKAKEKDITLAQSLGTFPPVLADTKRIKQVMFNLLDNALRYTNKGGIVTVRLIQVKDFLQVSVEDTGVGIPKAELPYIWERLYRVEKSRSRERGGTGLGLAIVKQIIELHGGTVYAQSSEGKGTIIIFRIPVPRQEDNQ